MELRCPNCGRLLARARMAEGLELKCPRCGKRCVFSLSTESTPSKSLTAIGGSR
ncbi:MAG: Com family DNA-binding transcriptional regulator [Desulfarculus sp.]|nr:Com family DNA-binding transcriptional regulator [Desulfarculus sp.]